LPKIRKTQQVQLQRLTSSGYASLHHENGKLNPQISTITTLSAKSNPGKTEI